MTSLSVLVPVYNEEHLVAASLAQRSGLPPAVGGLNEWKPDPPAEQFHRWGWHALKLGRKDAARGHSWSLLKLRPLWPEAWRLAFCALRGR